MNLYLSTRHSRTLAVESSSQEYSWSPKLWPSAKLDNDNPSRSFNSDRKPCVATLPLTSTSFPLAPKVANMNSRSSTGTSATALRRLMTEYKQLTAGGWSTWDLVNWRKLEISWSLTGSPDGMFTAGVYYGSFPLTYFDSHVNHFWKARSRSPISSPGRHWYADPKIRHL